jgi:hypothetical protein
VKLVVGFVSLLAFASNDPCGSSSTADSGTTEASVSTATAGSQCTKIETAFCQRAIDCLATSQSLSQCVADGNVKCCADKCNNGSTTSDQSLSACVDAVSALDCNSVATGVSPQACTGIPATQ